MLRKTGKEWNFESELALEDFVWANLSCLLGLSALKRQYAVNGEVCDILALDQNGGLVVLELKNVLDRYIVQQLTRYYDNLLDKTPLKQQVNYKLPVRLIAISPSFHNHNWIDKKYHKLNFEFSSFTIHQENNCIHFLLKNLITQSVSQAKIWDLSTTIINTSESTSNSYKKAFDDTLSYYVFVRHAHKLGIPELEPSEILRLSSQRHRAKPSKVFKIRLKDKDKYVSVGIPAKIGVNEFVLWVKDNIPNTIEVVSPNGCHYPVWN